MTKLPDFEGFVGFILLVFVEDSANCLCSYDLALIGFLSWDFLSVSDFFYILIAVK